MFVFTLVTIVFLPLDFIASLMSMPVTDYPRYSAGDSEQGWPIRTAFSWVFGVGTAILVPLMVLAVSVNHIAKFTEKTIKHSMMRVRKRKHKGHGHDSHPDSDEDSSEDELYGRDDDSDAGSLWRGSTRTLHSRHGSRRSASSVRSDRTSLDEFDPDYAPFLGRFHFHHRIPGLCRLWRYTASVPLNDDFSMESFRVYDYPFHRWVEAPLGRVAVALGLAQWWVWVVGAEDAQQALASLAGHGNWTGWIKTLSGRQWRSRRSREKSARLVETEDKHSHPSVADNAGVGRLYQAEVAPMEMVAEPRT